MGKAFFSKLKKQTSELNRLKKDEDEGRLMLVRPADAVDW